MNENKLNKEPLFVYGTLRVNHTIPQILQGCQILSLNLRIPGYRMFSCGNYPTVKPIESGNYSILGDLILVDKNTLIILDSYEDVDKGEYQRIWDSKHSFWIYVMGKNAKKIFFPIDHGIWQDFL